MKKYERYKDSGVQWLGSVPEHWEVMPMKYVLSCNDEVLDEKTNPSLEIDYVEISDVNSVDGICNSTKVKFGDAPSRARRIAREGDVIISTVRTYLKAIAPVKKDGYIVSTGFAVLRPKSINSDYLSYAVLSSAFIDSVIACSSGVSYPAIASTDLIALPISIPPLAEQIVIAYYLDLQVSKINAVIAEKEKMISDMEKYRSSLISETVTKGLNPNAPMKDSGVDWIGEVPEHWRITKTKYFISINSGEAISPTEIDDTNKYPVYGGGDVIGYCNKSNVDSSNILIGRVGARCGCITQPIAKAWATDNALVVSTTMHHRYLCYYLIGANLNRFNESNAQPLITGSKVKSMPIVVPDSEEQEQISEFLDSQTSKINTLISELTSQIEDLKSYKQSLITEAVTGQVDVRDWTPNE